MDVTSWKQWIHFRRSDFWPPTCVEGRQRGNEGWRRREGGRDEEGEGTEGRMGEGDAREVWTSGEK